MVRDRQNDSAWSRLLAGLQIDLSKATYPVPLTMRDLKEQGKREPRLMLSMDSREKWPAPLREHGVFPLSVSTTNLFLVKGDAWFDFPSASSPKREFKARLPFQLVSSTIGKGENAHIMRLETSGFLKEFLGAKTLLSASSGKRMAPPFEVIVNGVALLVKGAQYEMDLQYESEDYIVPVEAKTKHYGSCAIRQVYFPYRALSEDTKWSKIVRPLYVTYSDKADDYVIRELGFRRKNVWESIHVIHDALIGLKIEDPPKRILDLDQDLLPSPRVPQADAAWRIEEFPLLVHRGTNSAKTIAAYFGFNIRQSSYYRDATEILGLVESFSDGTYALTREGRTFVDLAPQARSDALARRMCRLPAMHAVLTSLEAVGEAGLPSQDITKLVSNHARNRGEPVRGSTGPRRAQTIMAWLRYIGSRTGTIVYTKGRFFHHQGFRNLDAFS